MKHKFILIWLNQVQQSQYHGEGFNDSADLLKHEASGFTDSFVIVNGVVYDTNDLDQAIADSEV